MNSRKYLIKGYFINLDRSVQRFLHSLEEHKKTRIKIRRWKATAGSFSSKYMKPNELACLRSHRSLLEHADREGIEHLLLLEDDVTFAEDFDYKLSDALRELPDYWEALYLGGNEVRPSSGFSRNLKRVRMMTGGFGIIFRNTIFERLIEKMKSETMIADHYYMKEQDTNRIFRTKEDLIVHIKGGFSEIHQKNVPY